MTPVLAQVGVVPWHSSRVTFTDNSGAPLVGGCIFTYAGGTSTPLATYTDYTGSTPNANPVVLDSTGSAVIWLGPNTYKFIAWSYGGTNCAAGAMLWTVDQIPGDEFLNGTISGATITDPTITGGTMAGTAISDVSITDSTIDNSCIGCTTPAQGSFTSLSAAYDALAFNATPVFNAADYGYFSMTLTDNVTSSTIPGGLIGQLVTWQICQNGTGQVVDGITTGFTFAWPASYPNAPAISPILNACTIVTAFYNGAAWITVSTTPQLLTSNFDQIPYSATPVFLAANYSTFALTLTGNVTSSTITGGVTGQLVTIDVCENATGSYTFLWPTNLLNAPPISISANACTGITAVFNGTNWLTISSSTASSTTPLTGNFEQIPFTATPIYNAASYSAFAMTLAGNVTASTIAPGTAGQLIQIALTQGTSITTAPASAPTFSTLTTGGALPATTPFYAVCSYIFGTVESLPSAEATETTGSGSTNAITWNCPYYAGVTTYKFYIGTTTGAENYYFTSSSASYVQIGLPNTGTAGIPLTTGSFTVSWPANLINPPFMATGPGATTALIAVFNGVNWIELGCSNCTSPTLTDLYFSFSGCTLVVSSNSVNCHATEDFSAVSPVVPTQPDADYYMQCNMVTGYDWGSSMNVNIQTTTSFDFAENVDRYNSISETVAPTVWCHIHHN